MTYHIFSQILFAETTGSYVGWGIEGLAEDGQRLRVEDISEDRAFVQWLAAALNAERAEPVHLMDIVEDVLAAAFTPPV